MNRKEAAALLGHCAAFDNRKPSEAAAIAWASALKDVPCDQDALDAVADFYSTPPKDPDTKLWIQPHNVRTLRAKLRSARLENFQYEPVDGESAAEYLARYRGQIQAIASGRYPAPANRMALEGGPSASFMRELEARGWQSNRMVPDSDEETVADTVRRAGTLGIQCPQCHAEMGFPCKSNRGTSKHPLGKPLAKPHAVRIRAAAGESETSQAERATAEARIREASRLALLRDQDIPDAEIVDKEPPSE